MRSYQDVMTQQGAAGGWGRGGAQMQAVSAKPTGLLDEQQATQQAQAQMQVAGGATPRPIQQMQSDMGAPPPGLLQAQPPPQEVHAQQMMQQQAQQAQMQEQERIQRQAQIQAQGAAQQAQMQAPSQVPTAPLGMPGNAPAQRPYAQEISQAPQIQAPVELGYQQATSPFRSRGELRRF